LAREFEFFEVRLDMKKASWFSRLSNQQRSPATMQRTAGSLGVAILLVMTGAAAAQTATPGAQMSVPSGYSSHETVDVGGHITGLTGSGAMYDTLVNMQSGPRVLGESFEMRALPGQKHTLVDSLNAIGSGFGGDPNSFARLNFYKGKVYEFSGIFRRDRQYFDYDLLGNPNITTGLSIPIGPSTAPTGSLAWPQVEQSPVMFNTVRRMTDTSLTLHPLSKMAYRAAYSQNVFEGPSLSPGESVGKYDSLLAEYQRNSTDDFTGGIDWKPIKGTDLTFEEQIDHYKADSYFTLAPGDFMVKEANGTPVSLGDWDSQTPYGISACNKTSLANSTTILYAPQSSGGKAIIDPACDVATSYLRSQPTRILYPTEIFRFQSSSVKNLSMNGDLRYTKANMNLPNYYENFQGLDGTTSAPAGGIRSITFTGNASAQREVVAADYGIVWEATKTVSLSDQVDYSNVHQPGTANISAGATLETPATAGNETINYSGPLTRGPNVTAEGSPNGTPLPGYFGQRLLTNDLTGSWDATGRATLSVAWRYRAHTIAEGSGNPGNVPLPVGADTNGTVTIHENGGIFNAALRPTANWNVNGSVEVLYADNAFTPVGPRQTKRYRVHTLYRPKPWATLSGAFNDLERHNNTGDNAATGSTYYGPLDHVDHSRVVSLGAVLTPNERYGIDFNYAYSDVYAATNICYDNGAQNASTVVGLPGTASTNSSGGPNVCPGAYTRGSTTQLADWFARDFMDAPTQYGSVALMVSPVDKIHSDIGYRISSVNGSRFFNDARDVNGSLVSSYQSPYVNLAWTMHPGLVWRAEYNFYGYGEGGPSGPEYCSTSTSTTSSVVPCTSLPNPTGLTESPSGLTAPRNFHANNVTLGVHYEF
jgi:hypothetical protein